MLEIARLQAAASKLDNEELENAANKLSSLFAADDSCAQQQNLAVSVQGGVMRSLLLILAIEDLSNQPLLSVVSVTMKALHSLSNRDAVAEEACAFFLSCLHVYAADCWMRCRPFR